MTRSDLHRRRFLQGLGAAAIPFVPRFEAHASSARPPTRLVFFFSSNGTIYEKWLPSMRDGKLVLSPILAPLERHTSRLLVVDGLTHRTVTEKSDRSGHAAGMNTVLTGRRTKIIDPADTQKSLGTGVSLDQHLAAKLGGATKLRSLECGVHVEPYMPYLAALSYRGPMQPILPESSPYRVFDRTFRDLAPPSEVDRARLAERIADRRRLLTHVARDLDAMRRTLPQDDRIKLDAHLDAVRGIEHALSTGAGQGASSVCAAPPLGAPLDVWKNENIPAIGRMQIDLLVMALACDLTRIGTIQFGRAGALHRFSWLGKEFETDPMLGASDQAKGFHALAHRESDPECRAKLVRINTWYAGELAYLLDRLAAIPEAGGSMLDHTVVVWINELGSGGDHRHERTPWVIAGNAGKHFKTGRLVSFPGEPHNRMLLSLAHAMGVEETEFGDPDYCHRGPLTDLTA